MKKQKAKAGDGQPEYDADETREQWKARMQKVYSGYKYPYLRVLVNNYYEGQERRLAQDNRNRTIFEFLKLTDKEKEPIASQAEHFRKAEREMEKAITEIIEEYDIYKEYLSKIRGIGPITSACLIAYIQDIGRFDTISKLWRYSGLSAINGDAQRRHAGVNIDFNPKMKTLMFKIGKSFLTSHNETYRKIYDDAHAKYESRGKYDAETNPGGNKNKLHTMYRALKIVERIFQQNLWVKWRTMEGLPISEPYVFAIGGHDIKHKIVA